MSRCDACPGTFKCIGPDGDCVPGGLLFVGEAPGVNEERKGQVFVGNTGQEVNDHYLPLAFLRRYERKVTFTNAIACLPDTPQHKLQSSQRKHLDLLRSCAIQHLYPLIEEMQPSLIIPMGAFACRAVLPGIDLEWQHGFPFDGPFGKTFPMYHPALGMHEPKKMLYIREDWGRLGLYLRDQLRLPVDPYPEPDYAEATTPADIRELDPRLALGLDTESDRKGQPVYLTYSQSPGSGRLVRADHRLVLQSLSATLQRWEAPVLFHNLPHDWGVCREMGVQLPERRLVDTMVEVYHLGHLPQGLKTLAWRLLGMDMDDFPDVVRPYSLPLVLDYYRRAQQVELPKPKPRFETLPNGDLHLKQPQKFSTKLKAFFTYFDKDPESRDPFEMWDSNWKEDQSEVEAVMGPWPGMDIRHVPFDQALYYACRDADATLRLWFEILKQRPRVRRLVQDQWGNYDLAQRPNRRPNLSRAHVVSHRYRSVRPRSTGRLQG